MILNIILIICVLLVLFATVKSAMEDTVIRRELERIKADTKEIKQTLSRKDVER